MGYLESGSAVEASLAQSRIYVPHLLPSMSHAVLNVGPQPWTRVLSQKKLTQGLGKWLSGGEPLPCNPEELSQNPHVDPIGHAHRYT